MVKSDFSKRAYPVIFAIIFAASLAPLLYQFIYNRSLWLDESMLALNIIEKDFGSLLKPLDHSQVAPVGFLLVEKSFVYVFGNSDWALRLFPLIASILSLLLFYFFCLSHTKSRTVAIIGILLLAITPKFVYYSSEVKQYASDLLVILSIYSVCFNDRALLPKNRSWLIAIVGAAGIFMSNAAVIALAVAGMLMLYNRFKTKKDWIGLIIPFSTWLACFSINYFFFIKDHPTTTLMQAYWADYFMPADLSRFSTYDWLLFNLLSVFQSLLPMPFSDGYWRITFLLMLIGLLSMMVRSQWKLFFLYIMPLIIHLTLSVFRIYPFADRLVLYQMPLYTLLIANGLYQLTLLFRKWPVVQCMLVALAILVFTPALFRQLPMKNEEIRPVIQSINKHIEPGHTVYLYYGCKPAFHFYQKTGIARFGEVRIIEGTSHADDRDGFARELDHVNGLVWLIFSHVYPFDGSRGEEMHMINQLRNRGSLLKYFESYGSSGYLFDLGPVRHP